MLDTYHIIMQLELLNEADVVHYLTCSSNRFVLKILKDSVFWNEQILYKYWLVPRLTLKNYSPKLC